MVGIHRVQVAEELALSVAEMSFLVSYWLIHFVPETTKWPANVERKVINGHVLHPFFCDLLLNAAAITSTRTKYISPRGKAR